MGYSWVIQTITPMEKISRPQQTHSLERQLEARQHCINYNFSHSLCITSCLLKKKNNTQTTCVFLPASNCHHPDTGRKKGGRDAAWCNPSEGHHASRLNNVFPMPCQTFSRLWAARQPLQPHSMKHLSLCMVGNSLFDPDIAPQIPQRWHSYTRLYVSWMFTSSLYLVSGETCVYEAGVTHTATMNPLVHVNQQRRLRTQTQIKLHIRFNFLQTLVWSTANRDDVKWYRQQYGSVYIIKIKTAVFSSDSSLTVKPSALSSHTNPTLQNNSSSCVQLH